ncbi:MAG: acetyl-CoA carboxylase carboxyl transferase subunit alpha, partial [Christensenella sp.]
IWKDPSREPEAALQLHMTAPDLLELGVIEKIVAEPKDGAHDDVAGTAKNIKKTFTEALDRLSKMSGEELADARYKKFRDIGVFLEK